MADERADLLPVARRRRGLTLTRRQLLTLAAGSAVSLALPSPRSSLSAPLTVTGRAQGSPAQPVTVIRAKDMLVLTFYFDNLALDADLAALVRIDPTKDAYVSALFPPQSFLEQALPEGQQGVPAKAESNMSGVARLAFKVPSTTSSIPYTLDSLLNWSNFLPSVVANAQPPGSPAPGRPSPTVPLFPQQTAIEVPFGLILSPNQFGRWSHALDPVSYPEGNRERVELWHTRLGVVPPAGSEDEGEGAYRLVRADEKNEYYRTVRAVWMRQPDYRQTPPQAPEPGKPPEWEDDYPFLSSLTPRKRWEIVRLTSDYSIQDTPAPIQADQLMLSPLGAWLDVHGAWVPPTGLSLKEWEHRATMGRDHYVRTVDEGYLFPLGHRAALVTITERKIESGAAYLRQRQYVVILDREKTYPGPDRPDGRRFPFRRLRLTTRQTPDLELQNKDTILGFSDAYWLQASGTGSDIQFQVIAEDADGRRIEFVMPLAFVAKGRADTSMTQIMDWYKDPTRLSPHHARRRIPMNGQKLALAASTGPDASTAGLEPGANTYETSFFSFGMVAPAGGGAGGLTPFHPTLAEADVKLTAAAALAGTPGTRTIELDETYIRSGFSRSANKGAVFARLKPGTTSPRIQFDGEKAGGLATPDMSFAGLSGTFGTVGEGIDELIAGTFDPAKLLGAGAKILGSINLTDILPKIDLTAPGGGGTKVPNMGTQSIFPSGPNGAPNLLAPPTALQSCLVWTPTVQSWPAPPEPPMFVVNHPDMPATSFSLRACLTASLDAARLDPAIEPTYEVEGILRNFAIDLIPKIQSFIVVKFDELRFTAKSGKKPDVSVKIADVGFVGPLAFVETLQRYIQTDGTGLGIDVNPTGIRAGYTLGLPSVTIGILSIQNISLSAGVNMPLRANAPFRLRFAFCERENPFLLTVSMFGGGGFLALGLGLEGVEVFEAALEFGANISVDFGGGAVSGGVYVMAGLYYKMEGDEATLTGYLRMGGYLDALGLLTVSVELYLGLTYDFTHDKVWGQARLTISIDTELWSGTIEYTVERKFAGARGDPTFADLVPTQPLWDAYCDAFAA